MPNDKQHTLDDGFVDNSAAVTLYEGGDEAAYHEHIEKVRQLFRRAYNLPETD